MKIKWTHNKAIQNFIKKKLLPFISTKCILSNFYYKIPILICLFLYLFCSMMIWIHFMMPWMIEGTLVKSQFQALNPNILSVKRARRT